MVALLNIIKVTLLRLFITPCIIHSGRNIAYLNVLYPSEAMSTKGECE